MLTVLLTLQSKNYDGITFFNETIFIIKCISTLNVYTMHWNSLTNNTVTHKPNSKYEQVLAKYKIYLRKLSSVDQL